MTHVGYIGVLFEQKKSLLHSHLSHTSVFLFSSGNQSVLSTSYKIMVDVPDPPRIESGEDDTNSSSDEVFDIQREKSPTPAKIHHLFVKVPPKQTAKFERMVRRNRTLEHEVKVYHELLRDLQNFITERLPRNPIQLVMY